jgi:glycosyltransferase involved in cell wall biosynthesis
MKILMISSYLPFPLRSGGEIRLYNLIKNISEEHDITLICEKRDYQTEDDISEVKKICKKVITVSRKKQWSTRNIIKAGFSADPFLIVGHTSDEFKLAIRDELVRESYDLIHVETFYVYQNLPKVSIPVVLVEHNVEYLVYQRYTNLASPILKPLLLYDVLKLKRKEKEAWKRVDKLIAVSNVEKKLMKRADIDVVPNGVDTQNFSFRNFQEIPNEKRILYIGDFKWLQNKDALEYILKQIWPKISSRINAKLWIVGRNIPESIKGLAQDNNIILDENNKEETPQIFSKSYLLLAPFRVAGGTSYKILEAMSSGVAIVTTHLGIEGLEAKNNVHLLSSETSLDLSNQVIELLTDHSLYKRLTLNARKFVEEKYDWKIISKKLEEVYMSAI